MLHSKLIAAVFAMSVLQIHNVAAQETNLEPGFPEVNARLQNVIDARVADQVRQDISATRHARERTAERAWGAVIAQDRSAASSSTGAHTRHYRIPVL